MKHSKTKKRIVLLAALICIIAVVATGTLAYFTAEETVNNVITTGVLDMDLVEETTGGVPFPTEEEGGIGGVMPGQVVDKVAYIVNTGNVDLYARVKITTTCVNPAGEALPLEGITLDYNTTDWTEKDGWYYYNKVVKPGEKTTPIIKTVTFDVSLGNEYMDAHVEVLVEAQSVQVKHNGESALEAAGWTTEE